ncbi:MAG: hypothetical protein JSV88_00330 [Candidatus Aminicenantes bacterium]|nr:MAG: hypothetical protein JSV88_00330 [Candidatus Aminicenantes bacterium]
MRKSIFLIVFVLGIFLLSTQINAQGCLKLLKIEEPARGKNRLNLMVEHAKAIVAAFNLEGVSADIQFADLEGNVLATLGKVKNGSIKWDHKIVDGTFLQVKFKKSHYAMILEKVKEKSLKPGFRLQLTTAEGCEITFMELPDLAARMKYPIKAAPGAALAKEVSITLENKGTVEARNFNVELVISSDLQIPIQPAAYSENFQEDALLEGGQGTVAAIKPGESLTISLPGTLKIPADTLPGKYYLAAVADPGNKIEELDEENNKDTGFIMIEVPEPKMLTLEIPDAHLVYQPTGFSLKILAQGAALSDGKDWRKCTIRPYIHQFKNATWEDFFWEVETMDRSVWRVKGIKFCQKGGTAKEIKMPVEVKGGSSTTPPARFTLRFSDTRLEYEPAAGKFRIMAFGDQIAHASLWRIFKLKSHLYQLKHLTWSDFYWEVDTFKNEVRQVTGGNFGQTGVGGTVKVLDIKLNLEY